MSTNDNVKTVQSLYEAFGRGDVAFILEAVTDDVDWASEAAGDTAPWWGHRQGKAAVQGFFESLGATTEVEEFTPLVFAADGDDVLTVVAYRARSRATGKVAAMQIHHHWRFRDGKVAYYRGSEDTIQTEAMLTA